VEQAVDMETGAIVAVTTHPGAAADSATVAETLCEAGEAVAELIDVKNAEGQYPVAGEGIAEVVADKGYHSNQTMIEIQELGLRTYVAEPDRGPRNWDGKAEEREAVYANRRRINGERGKRLQSQRGEKVERNFTHQFDTGGMARLYLRGRENIHKRLLIQAAACNLALLLRCLYGAGKPRAAHDLKLATNLAFLRLMIAVFGAALIGLDP
jgi:transposase